MKIDSSAISMQSSHSSQKIYQKEESLKLWIGQQRPDFEGRGTATAAQTPTVLPDVTMELSEQAKTLLQQSTEATQLTMDEEGIFDLSSKDKLKIAMLEKMLQALTGKKIKIRVLDKIKLKDQNVCLKTNTPQEAAPQAPQGPQRQGWGLEYDLHQSYYEQEKMSFASQGIIKTADGREINFSVQLNMSREFYSRQDISLRAGDAAIDPLVINFDGRPPGLTSTKFNFDLDSDGKEDNISFVGPGSGFLALDTNGDGLINNGKELFGPSTGSGFLELAKYDDDGNGWIDESDDIFDRLRVWTKDEKGKDVLFALGQKGIGAIYLGNINSSFDMKDEANNLQGQIAQSGVYVKEDGKVGTIQKINLVI
ncbi:MAG: hypothetical protein ACYDEQ_07755 [Desulfocucumaceae bacterium]